LRDFVRGILPALVIALGWSTAAQAVAPFPDDCKLVRQASLPFVLDRGHIMIDAAVNDHPLHFIVDTGGAFSAITEEAAQAAGLHSAPLGMAFRIKDAGGAEASRYARIQYITFGKFRSENLTLMVARLPPGEDGILAPELLRNFDIELDFAAATMNLFKRPRCDDHVVYWTDDFVKLPMRITEQGHIQIPVIVNGQTIKATIDTGAPFSLISNDVAKAVIGEGKESGQATLRGGSGGKVHGIGVMPDSLIVGKFKWLSPTLISTADKSGWRADGSDMLLGLDVLHDLHLFIDYGGEQLYVSKR
jgi:clan AA aspartic protease (TIGR02281 family)